MTWCCERCFKKFPNCDLLQEHCQFAHEESENSESNSTSVWLDKNASESNTDFEWCCKKCSTFFPTSRSLQEHIRATHPRRKDEKHFFRYVSSTNNFVCNVCSEKFETYSDAEQHVSENHKTSHNCYVCNVKFDDPIVFSNHMQTHDEEKMYRCPFCNFPSKKRWYMKQHIETKHFGTYGYYCASCGKGFKEEKLLREHEHTHTGVKAFICVVCSQSFNYSQRMLRHQIDTHTVCSEGEFKGNQCHTCKRIFVSAEMAQKHMKTRHSEDYFKPKTLLCDICGKSFAAPMHLDRHRSSQHTGIRNFKCQYCDKRFTAKQYCRIHEMAVHTLDKLFTCDDCGKSFTRRTVLNRHRRTHTGEKPYVCSNCGKGFTQRSILITHERTHTGERPYTCDICNKDFISKIMLNFHRKRCSV